MIRRVAVASLLLMVVTLVTPVASAAAYDFPAGWEGYHTYAEMSAVIHAVAAAHPDIVRVSSIGETYQGRDIWLAKISDNVATDEPEPEVLFDGLHHAREHMTLEMTLAILRWLADGYGHDTQVTRLVDGREIWIIFAVNPDGAEYDIWGGKYHLWRKNRQPTPGSTSIGTDLNRNYDYRWGCCHGSSGDPANLMYRGWTPFSAPETRAVRDFVNSRVVDGRQQIRAHITFHTSGRLVMWPYGYTLRDVPGDMTADDHAAFVAMGRAMAGLDRYTPEQASDLYITDGRAGDWMYGRHRIFTFTFELSHGWYPDDSEIGPETARNRSAVLYLIDAAACPWRASGKAVSNCGPFYDDLEISRGWVVDPHGTDTASAGAWQRGNPEGTSYNGAKQLDVTASGSAALVTGLKRGAYTSTNDLDGGVTSVRSPAITLPAVPGRLTFAWYFSHLANASNADYVRAIVEAPDGDHVVFEERGGPFDDDAAWSRASIDLSPFAGRLIRIRFEAADLGPDSLVEAAIDDVRVTRP